MSASLLRLLVLAATLLGVSARSAAQTQLYATQNELEQDLGQSLCRFDFDAGGVLRAAEVDGITRTVPPLYDGPGANQNVGPVLTFLSSPPYFTIETLEAGANFTFDDDENAGNLPKFDNALSIGDIDNQQNDDFRVTLQAPATAAAFVINDNTGFASEQLHLLDEAGSRRESLSLTGISEADGFVGVISAAPFYGYEFDEDPGGDDAAVSSLLFTSCTGPDSFEPDTAPEQGPFLEGFDFLNDNDIFIEHVRNLSAGDVDWTVFATTYNYPTSWSGAEPNTKIFVQLCQGACDGLATESINLQIFNFELISDPSNATPVFELNACPGMPNDETEQILPNFVDDETLFVRVASCSGASAGDYRIIFRRNDIGIDLHKVTGQVTLFNDAGGQSPAPAFAVITSNYNDFTFANPADGTFAIGLLARNPRPPFNDVEDLELTVTLFRAPFEATQSKIVTGMTAAESQVINFQLNLFRNGFEDP